MKMIDCTIALRLAKEHVAPEFVILEEYAEECDFGFYFGIDTRKHQLSGRMEDVLFGVCGVLVDRTIGHVHYLGSAHPPQYWFEAFQRGLHLPCTIIVKKVYDRQRAAEALLRLGMSFIIPEEACGVVWRIPQRYELHHFRSAFDDLPAYFENQSLVSSLREIQRIEKEHDLRIEVRPATNSASTPVPENEE